MRKAFWLLMMAGLLALAFTSLAFAEEVKMGGVLRWREINDPPTLDPALATDTTSDRVNNNIFEVLVEYDKDAQKLMPSLAESWEANENATVWTFHLRKGVHFHKTIEGGTPTVNGGREMVASDVKKSFERLVKVTSPRAYFIEQVKGYKDFVDGKAPEWTGIKVIDDYTVQFELSEPFAPFLPILSYRAFSIVPFEDAEKWGKDNFTFHPVGTGPFAFEKWDHDQKVVLKKNPDYWGKDAAGNQLPYVDTVEFVTIPDDAIAYEEFKKGNYDVLPDVPEESYKEIKANYSDGRFQERPWIGTYYIGLTANKKPLDNVKLRQALNYAVNREAINEMVLNGRFIPAKGVLPPGMPGYNPDLKGYSYDPEKAKALLAEAGYPDGIDLNLQYNTSGRHKRVCEALQGQLSELGIRITVKELDWGAHLDACKRGEPEMFRMGWVVDYIDPDNFLFVNLHSSNFGDRGNYSFYKNEKVDKLLSDARSEPKWEKRIALYHEAEQLIVDDAAWIFLFYYTTSLVSHANVRNIQLPAMGDYMTSLKDVWVLAK